MNIFNSLVKPAYAQICNPALTNGCAPATAPKTYINGVLQGIVSIFFLVGIIYFVWHFVFAAFHFISSEGDPKKYDSAKNEILFSAVGLIILFSLFAILKLIGTVTGITGLENLQIAWPSL